MRTTRIYGILLPVVAIVLGVGVAPAAAQGRTVDIGFGYQFVRATFEDESRNYPLGLNADFSIGLSQSDTMRVAILGDIGWSHHFADEAGSHAFNISGGLRVGFNRFYIQGLYGLLTERGPQDVQSLYETDPMFQVGGGIQAPLRGRANLFGQAEYRQVQIEGDDIDPVTGFRVVVGVRVNTR